MQFPTLRAERAGMTYYICVLAVTIVTTIGIILPQNYAAAAVMQPGSNPALNYSLGISDGETLQGMSASALNAELNDLVTLHIGRCTAI